MSIPGPAGYWCAGRGASVHCVLVQAELKNLIDISSSSFEFAKELIRHNLVVFRGGEGALQVLPPLIDVISEARLNLVIYYLRQGSHTLPTRT